MNNLVFLFEAFNPNKRITFFKHKNYTNYLAYSEYAIKNTNTEHGLFGKISEFPNIENMQDIELVNKHITNLANKKIPIYRCTLSLNEYDAMRLGYDSKEKWKELFESKLVSFAKKMNIRYEDLQYVGAVHLENGHPHLQVMMWSKQKDKMNYFIKYDKVNKMKDEFTNAIFKEDLLQLYKEKDIAKKNIIQNNSLLQSLKKVSTDQKFLKDMVQYEKDFHNKKIMKKTLKNKNIKSVASDLIKIKQLSRKIIDMSLDTQEQVDKYILTKQKIVAFKYSNEHKVEEAQKQEKEKAEAEIIKMIGNQILNFERVLLNQKEEYTQIRYYNDTENLMWRMYIFFYKTGR